MNTIDVPRGPPTVFSRVAYTSCTKRISRANMVNVLVYQHRETRIPPVTLPVGPEEAPTWVFSAPPPDRVEMRAPREYVTRSR